MLWHVTKYKLFLNGGHSSLKLDRMFGVIQQLTVIPANKETIWSLQLVDADFDVVYEKLDNEGRFDERGNIPIGNQTGEELTLKIYDSTSNEEFRVIVKVREIV